MRNKIRVCYTRRRGWMVWCRACDSLMWTELNTLSIAYTMGVIHVAQGCEYYK